MRIPRIYQTPLANVGDVITLNNDAFAHVIKVLRMNTNDHITLFNGQDNIEFLARLSHVEKKSAQATIVSTTVINNESPLNIHLGQGISRGERMDFTLQKSVELGVNSITPIFTERCGIKLSGERLAKKHEQWQKIVISACEQSGRVIVPIVHAPVSLSQWLTQETSALKINLHPKAEHSIMTLPQSNSRVRILIGPEGGLSDDEINEANNAKFHDVLLGPRVLRTETAALTAITALQCRYGDLT